MSSYNNNGDELIKYKIKYSAQELENKLDKVIGYYQTGAKTWNVIAQLYNSKQSDASKRMTYLPTNVSPTNQNQNQNK